MLRADIDSGKRVTITDSLDRYKTNDIALSKLSQDYVFNGVTFDAPIPCFIKFYDIIESHRIKYDVPQAYIRRPELVAADVYGNTDLWWLVLYSAKIPSHEEFNLPSIKIFDPTFMQDLLDIIERSDKECNRTTVLQDRTMEKVR